MQPPGRHSRTGQPATSIRIPSRAVRAVMEVVRGSQGAWVIHYQHRLLHLRWSIEIWHASAIVQASSTCPTQQTGPLSLSSQSRSPFRRESGVMGMTRLDARTGSRILADMPLPFLRDQFPSFQSDHRQAPYRQDAPSRGSLSARVEQGHRLAHRARGFWGASVFAAVTSAVQPPIVQSLRPEKCDDRIPSVLAHMLETSRHCPFGQGRLLNPFPQKNVCRTHMLSLAHGAKCCRAPVPISPLFFPRMQPLWGMINSWWESLLFLHPSFFLALANVAGVDQWRLLRSRGVKPSAGSKLILLR